MPPWLKDTTVIVAMITVSGSLIGAVITSVVDYFVNREKAKTKSQYDVLTEQLTDLTEQMGDVRTIVTTNTDKLEILEAGTSKIQKAEKKTQRYRLFQDLTNEIQKGHTTLERFRELSILFGSYKDLGGNGEIEALFTEYSKLEKQL